MWTDTIMDVYIVHSLNTMYGRIVHTYLSHTCFYDSTDINNGGNYQKTPVPWVSLVVYNNKEMPCVSFNFGSDLENTITEWMFNNVCYILRSTIRRPTICTLSSIVCSDATSLPPVASNSPKWLRQTEKFWLLIQVHVSMIDSCID